jgi:CheY-like chemotaxis protein
VGLLCYATLRLRLDLGANLYRLRIDEGTGIRDCSNSVYCSPAPPACNVNRRTRVLVAGAGGLAPRLAEALHRDGGYQVSEAATGPDAIRLFMKEEFDLLLIDVDRAHLKGARSIHAIRATEAMRAAENRGRRTPIYALTAHPVPYWEMLHTVVDGFLASEPDLEPMVELARAVRRNSSPYRSFSRRER